MEPTFPDIGKVRDMKTLGFFVFPNFNILDLSGPLAAFDVPRREVQPSPYRLEVWYRDAGRVVSSCGVSVNTVPLGRKVIDTFQVGGGMRAIDASHDPGTINLVPRVARHAA